MKKSFMLFVLSFTVLFVKAQTGILLVHYGTQNDKSRQTTIEVIDSIVRVKFPHCIVEEAYAAPSVIRSLEKRGVYKMTVMEAMARLQRKGCKKVVVQSTMLLDGTVTSWITNDVNIYRGYFDHIEIAKPLLYSVDDCRDFIRLIAENVKADKDEQVVLVGHGTVDAANAMYSQIDYMAQNEGFTHYHVGTIEGYPSLDHVMKRLSVLRTKSVVLVPLLFIAGNHQVQDIDGEWKEKLQQAGYKVNVEHRGLGEYKAVQEKIIKNIIDLIAKD